MVVLADALIGSATRSLVFDVDTFVEECRAALGEAQPQLAVQELLNRAVSRPGEMAAALGEPEGTRLVKLHASPELTVAHIVWAPGLGAAPTSTACGLASPSTAGGRTTPSGGGGKEGCSPPAVERSPGPVAVPGNKQGGRLGQTRLHTRRTSS